jgi:hypothetical protein
MLTNYLQCVSKCVRFEVMPRLAIVYVMSYASKIPGSRLYHYLCLFDAPKNRICTFQLLHYPSEMLAMLERR